MNVRGAEVALVDELVVLEGGLDVALFSERSPNERATLILSAISTRFSPLRYFNSSSKFLRPSLVSIFFFIIIRPFGYVCIHTLVL